MGEPNAELIALVAVLDAQRRHVVSILDGLDDEALRRPVLPSGWSCVGLVSHLLYDVERFWFRCVVDGDVSSIEELDGVDAWQVPATVSPRSVLDAYRAEVAVAGAIIEARTPDTPPEWWPVELFGDFRLDDLRAIVLHVIAETACHAGHLDAARELIDGTTYLVLT